jgi:hypothetical protein
VVPLGVGEGNDEHELEAVLAYAESSLEVGVQILLIELFKFQQIEHLEIVGLVDHRVSLLVKTELFSLILQLLVLKLILLEPARNVNLLQKFSEGDFVQAARDGSE